MRLVRMLQAKTHGMVLALQQMSREERHQPVSGIVTRDYATLRALVKALGPDIEPLLPPELTLRRLGNDHAEADERLTDLFMFASQLNQVLLALVEIEPSEE